MQTLCHVTRYLVPALLAITGACAGAQALTLLHQFDFSTGVTSNASCLRSGTLNGDAT